MTIDNFIETKYRELGTYLTIEYIEMYETFSNRKLQEIFSTLHGMIIENFNAMNSRLPTIENTAYYWADNSRALLLAFDMLRSLERVLRKTDDAFTIDSYYKELINKSSSFLRLSGGSEIPQGMKKIILYYTEPIFKKNDSIVLKSATSEQQYAKLQQIGEGSYAKVYIFNDAFYERKFVLKRANKNLNIKEIQRFRQEYEQMKKLSSPYVIEVFHFDEEKNEYIMEYMDSTLKEYIENEKPSIEDKKRIINQIFQAFKYIHSKNILHRDISPNNILIKIYEDVNVVKLSDFGLVKVPDSNLTSIDTVLKGCYNDPTLITEGFGNYSIFHETYAITRLIAFILTGKATADRIQNNNLKLFVEKGLCSDKNKRYKSVDEMIIAFKRI